MHGSDSVALFIERATAASAAFRFANANADAVASICEQVDGIPLAIELAAARVRAMSVERIAAQHVDRFRLLTGGDRMHRRASARQSAGAIQKQRAD